MQKDSFSTNEKSDVDNMPDGFSKNNEKSLKKGINIGILIVLILILILLVAALFVVPGFLKTYLREEITKAVASNEPANEIVESHTSVEHVENTVISNTEAVSGKAPTGDAEMKNQNVLIDVYIKDTDTGLNMRALPQHNSDLVYTVTSFFTPMYYYGEAGQGYGSDGMMHSWYKVYLDNGLQGWVRSDLVISQNSNQTYNYASDNEGTDYVKYTNGNLNIRALPQHDSALVGTITDCDTILHGYMGERAMGYGSDGMMHEWTKVLVNSQLQGWVRSDLILPMELYGICQAVYIKNVSGSLNVRSLPQHDSDLVGTIYSETVNLYYDGISAQGYGSDGLMHTWYKVKVSEDIEGWVRSDLVIRTRGF